MRSFLPILVVAAVATHLMHRSLDAVEIPLPADPSETLPSIEALDLMSLGYRELMADYYWLRAIDHYGDKRLHALNYPNLLPLMRRVVSLDPYFAGGYIFAGTALTTNDMDPRPSVELLKVGMEHRPDVWRIPFLLGFNAYYFLGDYVTASKALGEAAKLEGAPEQCGPLAARLAAEAGEPMIGIRMIDALLEEIQDPKLRESYLERRELLILEWQIQELDRQLDQFEARYGRRATSFAELIEVGMLSAAPMDPLGGTYSVGPDGRTATTSEDKRLRIEDAAKGVLP